MINKLKKYLEYRLNKKIAKMELTKLAANTLPIINNFSCAGGDIIKFMTKLAAETKNIEGERLIEIVINEMSNLLKTNNRRLTEVLTYIAGLTPDEINEILIHTIAETISAPSKVDKSRNLWFEILS